MAEIKREDIRLAVDGALYGGWKEVQVVRSIEQGALAFTLKVTEKWKDQPTRRVIRPGAPCTLSATGDTILVGYVDDVTTDYDVDQHTVTVVGRDKVGDLVDGAAAVDGTAEFLNLTLLDFAQQICAPYGVSVNAEADIGAPFARFAVQPGETAWAAIERACRHRALLPNGDGKGGLVLTRAGKGGRASGSLELGRNIKGGRGTFSYRDRFSLTVVRGQQEGADWLDGTQITSPEGRAKDGTITRYRPTVILAEQAGNGVSLQERAQWEVRVARGRSRNVVYRVAGWRDDGGSLWRPNTMVRVKDDYLDIDFDMLVVSVSFALTLDGSQTELQLSLPDAYDLLPEPDEASAGTGLWEGI
jgi:prophage tail gpP-like protein